MVAQQIASEYEYLVEPRVETQWVKDVRGAGGKGVVSLPRGIVYWEAYERAVATYRIRRWLVFTRTLQTRNTKRSRAFKEKQDALDWCAQCLAGHIEQRALEARAASLLEQAREETFVSLIPEPEMQRLARNALEHRA